MDYNWHSLLASLECSNIIPAWPIALGPVALWKAPLFAGNCMSAGTHCVDSNPAEKNRRFGSWSWKWKLMINMVFGCKIESQQM